MCDISIDSKVRYGPDRTLMHAVADEDVEGESTDALLSILWYIHACITIEYRKMFNVHSS